jgi:hypothetical protein
MSTSNLKESLPLHLHTLGDRDSSSAINIKQYKALIVLVVGIILTIVGIFLLLAAFQILPNRTNVISQWEIGSKVVGSVVMGFGIVVASVHSTKTHESIEPTDGNLSKIQSDTEQVTPIKIEILETPARIVPTSLVTTLSNNLKSKESLELAGAGNRRIVNRINNTDLTIKSLRPRIGVPIVLMQYECIMYEISELLNFGVVPYTQYVVPESEEAQLIADRCPRLNQPLILQRYIAPKAAPLNIEQAHKAIIFTWITGRSDTKRENSVIDDEGRVWEVDNELGGSKLKDVMKTESRQASHWLLDESEINVPIQNSLLNWTLQLPDKIKLNRTSLPDQFTESNISSIETLYALNLKHLKTAIRKSQKKDAVVTFELLKQKINTL